MRAMEGSQKQDADRGASRDGGGELHEGAREGRFQANPRGVPEADPVGEGVRGGRRKGDQDQVGGTVGKGKKEIRIVYGKLPSQQKFHDLKTRFKGFSGPIGSGKSQALCQEAIRLACVNHGRTGLIGAPTYPMLRDATQATLFEILDACDLRYDHNKAENTVVLRGLGSKILFRPVEEFERLRGTN